MGPPLAASAVQGPAEVAKGTPAHVATPSSLTLSSGATLSHTFFLSI